MLDLDHLFCQGLQVRRGGPVWWGLCDFGFELGLTLKSFFLLEQF